MNKIIKSGAKKVNFWVRVPNHLLFADDTALHATNKKDMQKLFDICDKWIKDYGMIFSPSKCNLVAKQKIRVSLYHKQIPQQKEATYLGLEFDHSGINFNHLSKKGSMLDIKPLGC